MQITDRYRSNSVKAVNPDYRKCPTDTVVTRRSPGLVFGNYEPQKSEYVESNRESRDGVEISMKNWDIPIKSGSVAGLK